MIFITHDFLEAIKMGDHIAIMKDGEVSQIGTPEEIVANPVNDYVQEFTEDVPRYKVLSAGKVMRKELSPAAQQALHDSNLKFSTEDKIEDLINQVVAQSHAIAVCDASGQAVGEIDQAIMLQAMHTRS